MRGAYLDTVRLDSDEAMGLLGTRWTEARIQLLDVRLLVGHFGRVCLLCGG